VILVCAATRTEAEACRRGIADARAQGIEVLTTGVGPDRAAETLTRCLRRNANGEERSPGSRPTLVVSSGFAGALTPGIDQLGWITASAIHRFVDGRAVLVALPEGLLRVAPGATVCDVISAERAVAGTVSGLRQPAAADMESAALAEVAGRAGLPFLVLRMVTDTPTRPLASLGNDLATALAADRLVVRTAGVARAALDAARSPVTTVTFLREALTWRYCLRQGWREHALRGLAPPVAQAR
jgi:nucleoside phosphorylase